MAENAYTRARDTVQHEFREPTENEEQRTKSLNDCIPLDSASHGTGTVKMNAKSGSTDDLSTKRTTEDILSSINHLTKLKEFLLHLQHERLVGIAAAKHPVDLKMDEDDLSQRIDDARKKLVAARALVNLHNGVLETLTSAKEVFKAFQPKDSEPCADDTEYHRRQQQIIREKMYHLNEINRKIFKTSEEKEALKVKNVVLDKEIRKIVTYNRMKMEDKRTTSSNSETDTHSKVEQQITEEVVAKIRRLKHVFQSLVIATGLDIYDNPDLKSLVLDLGQPESLMLTSLNSQYPK